MKSIRGYFAVALFLSCTIVIFGFGVRRGRGDLTMASYWRQQLLKQQNNTLAVNSTVCPATSDVDTTKIFSQMNFQASWIGKKYFWHSEDFDFQSRHETHQQLITRNRNIVQVFILPHSHNDPGWRRSYDEYFIAQTRHTLNNAVEKLTTLPKMTFIWSEITYLAKWWKTITPKMKEQFINLVEQGRLEIGTGGWVMPDEATGNLYSLVHELTEGQQWVNNHLHTHAKYSWAIDPFGHSSTYSHLLKASKINGMVIQRLHYTWKHWLAEHKIEEFRWRPRWDTSGEFEIPCLTLPFDLYSIKHACGPDPQVCLKFDFRKVAFEYGENYGKMTPITKSNVKKLAPEIVTQYHKTASLTNHNVILVPLGDDFRYDRSIEWDQQYSNYMELFSYINSNKDKFRMEIGFGTLRTYFEAVNKLENKSAKRPSLSGDFFPYGDVYVSGKPQYWTGFYGTRPYWKKFYREVENELRTAEILFTFANALARQSNRTDYIELLATQYHGLVTARHEFAVFAHHDGVTGTSKYLTMDDYGNRLYFTYRTSINLQSTTMKIIYDITLKKILPTISKDFLRERFDLLPSKIPLEVFANDEYITRVTLFNSLGWKRTELVKVLVKDPNVKVSDSQGRYIPSQINPVFLYDSLHVRVSDRAYELVFFANLDPLTFATFSVRHASREEDDVSVLSTIYCINCTQSENSPFKIDARPQILSIENEQTYLNFQESGLLSSIERKVDGKSVQVSLAFGIYTPIARESGAYLLKPDISSERLFLQKYLPPSILKIQGPLMSQVTTKHFSQLETIQVNTTLFNLSSSANSTLEDQVQSILVETYVDFSQDYSNKAEVFMRLDSELNSTTTQKTSKSEEEEVSVMFTDQNGFVSEKRVQVPSIGYEGNTYPVTNMVYIQDELKKLRLSVLVDRTHGFCSMKKGRLETLIERRSTYDDGRGMSEGVLDSKPTVSSYLLLLESLDTNKVGIDKNDTFSQNQPSIHVHTASLRLNYPPSMFVYNEAVDEDSQEQNVPFLSSPFPENIHLINMRMLSSLTSTVNETRLDDDEILNNMALMNLQYLVDYKSEIGSCHNRSENNESNPRDCPTTSALDATSHFTHLNISRIIPTSLTGIIDQNVNETLRSDNNTGCINSLLHNFKLVFK
ncbi:unnamed protein product [Orchesella dallaii]|uniref:Alpha-mannosidase n=1 Tax=Orchesella dallaii TaxID=48710 RepID=A0ABP1R148_9HEXA